jgi:hypothetical protein
MPWELSWMLLLNTRTFVGEGVLAAYTAAAVMSPPMSLCWIVTPFDLLMSIAARPV